MKNRPLPIEIDEYSKTPKYMQIVQSIIKAVHANQLRENNKLPSVNQLLIEFDISRDTIVKAYERLKELNVITSIPGKGYYILNTQFEKHYKILLIFNKLSVHKKIIYENFRNTLEEDASIDFYIYDNQFRLFKNLLEDKLNHQYTHYVIIPHFLEGGENALEIINQIPEDRLIIVDKLFFPNRPEIRCVYQDFSQNLFQALLEARERLLKYKKLNIIVPSYTYHPTDILNGFSEFCAEYAFDFSVIHNIYEHPLQQCEVYINLMESDLIHLLKMAKLHDLILGKDIGIISYNETPIKEILMDGITTVSTDFKKLGETAAKMVKGELTGQISNPFAITFRNSL